MYKNSVFVGVTWLTWEHNPGPADLKLKLIYFSLIMNASFSNTNFI